MNTIQSKIASELAAVVAHKGYNIVLSIKMDDGTKHNFELGTGSWDVAPTEEDGILTLRNNKNYAEKSTSQTDTTLTTTYSFARTNIEVAKIQSFEFSYQRDIVQTISTNSEE